MKIERDGVLYDEAVDPDWAERTYTETTEPVENVEHISKEQEYLKYLQMLGLM